MVKRILKILNEFDEIVEALWDDPEGFITENFESYYPEQKKILHVIQEKLKVPYQE